MMLEAAACSVAARRSWKHRMQPAPSWHGPEDSEATTPSQQFGQFGGGLGSIRSQQPGQAAPNDARRANSSSHYCSE